MVAILSCAPGVMGSGPTLARLIAATSALVVLAAKRPSLPLTQVPDSPCRAHGNGLARQVPVAVPYRHGDGDGGIVPVEVWYLHLQSRETWRLVWPEPPFDGIFKKIP